MTGSMLIYDLLIVALLAAAAWAAEGISRQLGRPARWVWLTSAALALLLVVRAALIPDASSAGALLLRFSTAPAPLAVTPEWTLSGALRDGFAVAAMAITAGLARAARLVPGWIASAAAVLWMGGSIVALATFALVHLRIRRARRGWPKAHLHGSRVHIAPDAGPAVVGVLRPAIVIPRWLLGCTDEEQRLVLAHETEHLRGRDHLVLGAGCLAVALLPWHPAAWWMLARLRLAIELDCDARVLRRGADARGYGALLIDLAGRCSGFRVGATALADGGSHLERRILAMRANRTRHPLMRAGALGSVAVLAVLAACEAKVPTAAEVEAMDVAAAQRAAASAQVLGRTQMDSAVFFVDGREVDASTAKGLAPSQIATVQVWKKRSAGTPAVIRITTNGQAPIAIARVGADSGSPGAAVLSPGASRRLAIKAKDGPAKRFDGLLLIDGIRADASVLRTLDPGAIESVEIIKGAAAEKISTDPAARNGIIKVTTRKR